MKTFSDAMRRDWDERARKDAYFYIASWRKDWDETSFFQSGEDDYKKLVDPVLQRFQFSSQGKTMLELGCGTGRMTRTFAAHFSRVVGFDVSREMLDRAGILNNRIQNITWTQGNGADLDCIPTGSVDFVFSYLVLQHLPAEDLVHAYVREILRILSSGGICLFQFNGTTEQYMNWKGRLAWRAIDSLWAMHLNRASESMANLLGMDPKMAGKSWHGVGVRAENVARMVQSQAASVLELSGVDTPMAWCCARKDAISEKAPSL